MTTSNPTPSTAPDDLLFNAGALDKVVNSNDLSIPTRLGGTRKTLKGIETDAAAQIAAVVADAGTSADTQITALVAAKGTTADTQITAMVAVQTASATSQVSAMVTAQTAAATSQVSALITSKSTEINDSASGVLARATTQATAAASSAAAAGASASAAGASATAAAAAASAAGPVKIFATKALANSGISSVPDGSYVEIVADETLSSHRTRYQRTGGSYTFALDLDARVLNALSSAVGSALVGFQQAGTGTAVRDMQAKARERFSVLDIPGADPTGVADSAAQIMTAAAVAKQLLPVGPVSGMPAFGAVITVDLCGGMYAVGSTVNMTGLGGVWLDGGMLKPHASLAAGSYLLRFGDGTTTANNSRYSGARNLNIECGTAYNGIDVNNVNQVSLYDINIHGGVNYGLRVRTSASGSYFERVRCSRYFYSDADRGDYTKRTGIGISSETSDVRFHACDALYYKTQLFVSGGGTHIFTQCHLFAGADNTPSWAITGAANNGAGALRLTFANTTGLTVGARVIVPWLDGVTSNAGASRPGVYSISAVTSTTIDIAGFTFAGTYSSAYTSKIWLHALEHECAKIDTTAGGVIMTGVEFDNGKVVVVHGAKCQFTGCFVTRNDDGTNRVGFELVSDGVSLADFAGVSIIGTQSTIPLFRITNISGGSTSAELKAQIRNNSRSSGALTPSAGVSCFPDGTAARPSIVFTNIADTTEDDGGIPSIDSDTGFYKPALNQLGVSCGGTSVIVFAQNSATFSVGPRAATDNTTDLGTASQRWAVVRAGTATINTSDETKKQDIGAVPDAWLDAWADVEWLRYKFRDAVVTKGDGSRWHIGVIAQRVDAAFAARGLDARRLGLLCWDQWEARDAVVDKAGAVVVPAIEAGECWGIRYEEALALEAALQRRERLRERMEREELQRQIALERERGDRLEAALQALTERVAALEPAAE